VPLRSGQGFGYVEENYRLFNLGCDNDIQSPPRGNIIIIESLILIGPARGTFRAMKKLRAQPDTGYDLDRRHSPVTEYLKAETREEKEGELEGWPGLRRPDTPDFAHVSFCTPRRVLDEPSLLDPLLQNTYILGLKVTALLIEPGYTNTFTQSST
jgi:hypothetical protein